MLCGNHFAIYKYQINMLYTLNVYNVICQLYLDKAGKKQMTKGKGNHLQTKERPQKKPTLLTP